MFRSRIGPDYAQHRAQDELEATDALDHIRSAVQLLKEQLLTAGGAPAAIAAKQLRVRACAPRLWSHHPAPA